MPSSSLPALAQQHANDMARRNSLDHAGFMQRRGPAGHCRECGDGMRNRGLCKANVDAVAAAPPKHDAWRVPGRRIRGIGQWPPVLGDGDRRQQSCWYPPYWRHSRSSHPQRQRSRWRCRPGFLRRWKQRALIGRPLLAQSGHRLVRCKCLLLTQSGHKAASSPVELAPLPLTMACVSQITD